MENYVCKSLYGKSTDLRNIQIKHVGVDYWASAKRETTDNSPGLLGSNLF